VDVDGWVDFHHSGGTVVRRPAFWDGGTINRVRFAPPLSGQWEWEAAPGLSPAAGRLAAGPPLSRPPHRALTRGFVTAHRRGFRHADGSPAFFVIDTAWAMPWRATVDDVAFYAADRRAKGFNAVLLMTVMPDMNARGPVGRNVDEGFEVGFHDLPRGRLTRLNVDYFRYFDRIVDVLVEHGITPVLQPVFHG
jgi:hypothetical protein